MKLRATTSKSIYRAILPVEGKADEESGLRLTDRVFVPGESREIPWAVRFGVDALMLMLLTFGLMLMVTGSFGVEVSLWLFPLTALECILAAAIAGSRRCARYWLPVSIVLLLLYLLLVFLVQDTIIDGSRRFLYQVTLTINRLYNGELRATLSGEGMEDVCVLLAVVTVPVLLWLTLALRKLNSLLMAGVLLFPLVALMALCGGGNQTAALFLLLFGCVLAAAVTRPMRHKRLWSRRNGALYEENLRHFYRVRKTTALLLLGLSLVLTVPGFYLVRPLLSVSLAPAEKAAIEVQSSFLSKMLQFLPDISAGQWNLQLEAVSGGVMDGAMENGEGYLLEGVEDLEITLSQRPTEPLFLKGFVGTDYQNGSWKAAYGSVFDGAALNWPTDGDARLYVANLPFLRTVYALGQRDSENSDISAAMSAFSIEPAILTVTRLHANEDYTYVPYGAYLNSYYRIDAGDGAVEGQQEQEDRFYFFPRNQYEEVLSAWNELEDTANVLDRLEESYSGFCAVGNLTVAEGLEELQGLVDSVLEDNGWTAEDNAEEITAWIRGYLAENYTYDMNTEETPEGEDLLSFFLFESKTGYSVHFASAAVELYRMFGIPARYVVGYELSEGLFTAQPGGSYLAVAQEDNAQAWAEVYRPGMGWCPEDMTPGVIGTYEEVGPGGVPVTTFDDGNEDETVKELPQDAEVEIVEEVPDAADPMTSALNRLLRREMTTEQMVLLLGKLVLLLLCLTTAAVLGRKTCRDLGYDPFHRRSAELRLVLMYRALYRRMLRLGIPKGMGSDDPAFLGLCEAQLARNKHYKKNTVTQLHGVVYGVCYGGKKVTEIEIRQMRTVLLQIPLFGSRKKA